MYMDSPGAGQLLVRVCVDEAKVGSRAVRLHLPTSFASEASAMPTGALKKQKCVSKEKQRRLAKAPPPRMSLDEKRLIRPQERALKMRVLLRKALESH